MAETTYHEILDMVRRLAPDEQLMLLERLASTVQQQSKLKSKRSLLDLQGLGKNIWAGLDPMMYIREERESWNG
jgi:hypothetical protein